MNHVDPFFHAFIAQGNKYFWFAEVSYRCQNRDE